MAKSEEVFYFLDALLGDGAEVDYDGAWNGLQVEGPKRIERVAAAVDASERVIGRAVAEGADLILAHHGLFWDPTRTLTGRRFRKIAALIEGQVALYASHLPLDRHPEVGNAALLLKGLGLEAEAPFGIWKGLPVGWSSRCDLDRTELGDRLARVLGDEARVIPGGPDRIERVAVVTGSGATFLGEAVESGVDTLITGEASHHAHADAHELGVNLLLGGHYRTETLGVRAVAERLEGAFGLPWNFIDDPSGF